ncbi:hypothetical protein [Paenibacillus glacialis]|uniref:DUF1795 domain-containing protein n=1 Tax=Paenibacillus glacialis TaxID=494026 RepID=A0A168N7W3_9BACL|nr:hypothetical protein [Paenibacillus glacialis]OAB45497.1 hypothetical protein PGLA_04395 [Paenibacillus glacialis]
MERADEKILKILNEMKDKTREPLSITDGPIKIGDQYYEFEEASFFNQRLFVQLPKDFIDMEEKHKKIKYPHEQRPEIIKTEGTGAINFTFSQLDEELSDYWVKELTNGMRDVIKKTNPSNVFYTTEVESVNGKQIGYFEFKGSAIDGFIYNIMYFLAVDGKTLMGTFTCHYKDQPQWRDIAFQVIRSIQTAEIREQEVLP